MSNKSSKKLAHKILGQHVPKLRESIFYKRDFLPSLENTLSSLGSRKIEHIICYGLGSFHGGTETASRYQLALLILIHEELIKLKSPLENVIDIFDPAFEELDIEALKSFSNIKFQLIEKNEYCAHKIDSESLNHVTLIYMPRLDKYLYNNLLGANWCEENIRKLVVLGNSFQTMIDFEISATCKSELYYLNLLVTNFATSDAKLRKRQQTSGDNHSGLSENAKSTALIELKVEISDTDYEDVFNNLAFDFISESWLLDNKNKIENHRLKEWERAVPRYSDSECFFD